MKAETEKTEKKLWGVEDAARFLKVSKHTVYRWTANGTLPCRKVGRTTRFLPSELEAWVASRPGGPTQGE